MSCFPHRKTADFTPIFTPPFSACLLDLDTSTAVKTARVFGKTQHMHPVSEPLAAATRASITLPPSERPLFIGKHLLVQVQNAETLPTATSASGTATISNTTSPSNFPTAIFRLEFRHQAGSPATILWYVG